MKVLITSSDKSDNDQILRVVFNVPANGVYRFEGDIMLVNGSDVRAVDSGVTRPRTEIMKDIGDQRPLFSLDAEWPDKGDRSVALVQASRERQVRFARSD